jgi:hypothetical protein
LALSGRNAHERAFLNAKTAKKDRKKDEDERVNQHNAASRNPILDFRFWIEEKEEISKS